MPNSVPIPIKHISLPLPLPLPLPLTLQHHLRHRQQRQQHHLARRKNPPQQATGGALTSPATSTTPFRVWVHPPAKVLLPISAPATPVARSSSARKQTLQLATLSSNAPSLKAAEFQTVTSASSTATVSLSPARPPAT